MSSEKHQRRRPKDPEKADAGIVDNPPSESDDGAISREKYHSKKRVMLLEVLALILVGIICFIPPSSSGGVAAVIKDSNTETYVGLLRECIGGKCNGWMDTGSSTSSASPSTTSSASSKRDLSNSDPLLPRASSTTSSSSTSGSLASISLEDLFLQTGLAALATFYLLLYVAAFLITRWASKPPLSKSHKPSENEVKTIWKVPDWLKRFIYRAGRSFLFVALFVLLGVTVQSGLVAHKAGTGTGTGVYVLVIAFLLLIPCVLIELSPENGRVYKLLTAGGGAFRCFGSNNPPPRSDRGQMRR